MILDTNAVSALFVGDLALERLLSSAPRHELPVIVIGEYRYGLARSKSRRTLLPLLEELIAQSTILEVEIATAAVYAVVREDLRARGTPISENDIWIGALAVQHGLDVASRDTDFDYITGLRRRTW